MSRDIKRSPARPSTRWPPASKESAEVQCGNRLHSSLLSAKSDGTLKSSLRPGTNEFEVLEFYGDAVLYERISHFIMTTRRFANPHLMTQLRMRCVRNVNLANVFDLLNMRLLVEVSIEELKAKADVVESILGELNEHDNESNLLHELCAFIAYEGEKDYFRSTASMPTPTNATMPRSVPKSSKQLPLKKARDPDPSAGKPVRRSRSSSPPTSTHVPPATTDLFYRPSVKSQASSSDSSSGVPLSAAGPSSRPAKTTPSLAPSLPPAPHVVPVTPLPSNDGVIATSGQKPAWSSTLPPAALYATADTSVVDGPAQDQSLNSWLQQLRGARPTPALVPGPLS